MQESENKQFLPSSLNRKVVFSFASNRRGWGTRPNSEVGFDDRPHL